MQVKASRMDSAAGFTNKIVVLMTRLIRKDRF